MTGHLLLICGHATRQLDAVNYEDGARLEIECRNCGATSWLISCGEILGAGDLGWHVVSKPVLPAEPLATC
jgi:hypothetical protein